MVYGNHIKSIINYPKSLDINVRDKNNLTNLGNIYLVEI